MKIDAYSHVIPQRYKDELYKTIPPQFPLRKIIDNVPTLYDLDHRFRLMDKFEGLRQVITLGIPPVEGIANPQRALDLSKIANDEMAELVLRYPDRFVAAAACLPMNDMDAALKEADRAMKDLNLKGVQISTPINDKPLDAPEFLPLFEKMAQYDLPIWIHPVRPENYADYRTEETSKYVTHIVFGWPYESTVAMTRLVFSGVLETYANLKIIIHHCGAMVPYLAQRIMSVHDNARLQKREDFGQGLARAPIEYYRMFYLDTAINGNSAALMCAHAFCGADHMLFGTDAPFDSEFGERSTRQTIDAIEQMDIGDAEKTKIFEDNIRGLIHLDD